MQGVAIATENIDPRIEFPPDRRGFKQNGAGVEIGGLAAFPIKEFGPAVAAGIEVGFGKVGVWNGVASGSVALRHLGAFDGDRRAEFGGLDDFDV